MLEELIYLEELRKIASSPLAITGMSIALAASVMIGIWIFLPVDRAARNRQHPTQFTIIDFFCLFFIIQLAMAIIHWQLGVGLGVQLSYVYLLDCFAWFACVVLWMKSVQFMSRAGIQRPWHRVSLLAIIIPGALALVMTIPILLSFKLIIVVNRPTNEDNFSLPIMLAILAAIPPILYILAKWTRMIVAAAEPQRVVDDDQS